VKRQFNIFEKLFRNTPVGMRKCVKHNVLFSEVCSYCEEEEYANNKNG